MPKTTARGYFMQYVFFLIIIGCALGNNVFKNLFAHGETVTDGDNAIYNVIACGIGAPMALIGRGFSAISGPSLLLSVLFGASMAVVAISTIKALRQGPMSLTLLFGDFSMVIPILAGFLLWQESISAGKTAGILLMFAAIYFMVYRKGEAAGTKEAMGKWAFWASVYGLSCGLMSFFEAMQTKSGRGEAAMFLFWGFTTATVVLLVYLVICSRKPETAMTVKLIGPENLNGLLVGIFGGISHIVTMKLLLLMDSSVLYPLKAGICIAANALLGRLLFKEKLTKRQGVGLVLGFAAVMLLTMAK